MKKFQININIIEEIEAEDEIDAKNKFFQMIESEPQQTLDSFINEHIKTKELKKHIKKTNLTKEENETKHIHNWQKMIPMTDNKEQIEWCKDCEATRDSDGGIII